MQNDSGACEALSLLTPFGYQSGDCGYCKDGDSSQRTPDSRASYYAKSQSLCPNHYQSLVDRGWRRSGTLFYLPDVSRSCCPHYIIRLPAAEFKPSRDQRQALHRWNRYVLGEKYIKEISKRHPKSKAEKKQEINAFDLISSLHESEAYNLNSGVEPEHKFDVTLEPDTFTNEKFALFSNYQRHVHHEGNADITPSGFKRFLCSSPLHRHDDTTNDHRPLGSYHHCYRLDGRLIAMAVLDLLPHAVSGVYFIYHSDFEKWSFGKLSALREAALALEQGYEYYYMGYYIHGCRKMRYKGDYKPQYVLDYLSGEWDPLDDGMRALMEGKGYVSMSRERRRRAKEALTSEERQMDDNGRQPHTNGTASSHMEPKEEGDDQPIIHSTPLAASTSNLSLLSLGLPGALTLAQLRSTVDLDTVKIYLGDRGRTVHEMREIVSWDSGSVRDMCSVKGRIAEFAAAVGPRVVREVAVDFSRSAGG